MNRNTENGSNGIGCAQTRRAGNGFVSLLVFLGAMTTPAFAQIESTATVQGRAGEANVEASSTESTDLASPTPRLSVSQQIDLDMSKGRNSNNADGGDTVSVIVTVANEGNFPVGRVVVDGAGISIGGEDIALEAASFDPPSEDIATGGSASFTALVSLTDEQVYRAVAGNGITVRSSVTGQAAGASVSATTEPGSLVVAANPQLAIATTSVLEKAEGNDGEGAETGDAITYKYAVENVGNVSVADVAVTVDIGGKTLQSTGTPDLGVEPFAVVVASADPLGENADSSETAGVFDNLGPGGAVEFTHVHIVTQEEFEAQ